MCEAKASEKPVAPDKTALTVEQLEELIPALQRRGYQVVGPVVREGAIVYDVVEKLADLPAGWTDEQAAGRYRLQRRNDQALFGYVVGPHSWKKYLHPAEIRLFAAELEGDTSASNEAELAGVMAHEMSHVYMQHSAKQAGKAQTTATVAGIAGAILGATTHGEWVPLAQSGIQFGAQGLILKYSRGDEAQADAVGAIILYKAGYNPQAMADFFKKLAAEGSTGPQFLSDHPNPGNREAAIQKEISAWPAKTYSTTSATFGVVRQEAMGVKAYSAQEISRGAQSGQWTRLNKQTGAVFKPPAGVNIVTPASLHHPQSH